MAKKPRAPFPVRLLAALFSPKALYYLLPYFMVILIAGTVAQKYIGIFNATRLYFNSFVLWLGPIPIPAGATVLSIIFLNLCMHFVTRSRLKSATLGTALAHLGVLVLLFGGLVTLVTKHEGFVILRYAADTHQVYDYHDRELAISDGKREIAAFRINNFSHFTSLHSRDLPFDLTITAHEKNATIEKKKTRDTTRHGLAATYRLKALPLRMEDEANQMGLEFTDGRHTYLVTEFLSQPPIIQSNGKTYSVILRRAGYELPFDLSLRRFDQENYPGTDVARSYTSDVAIVENGHEWPAFIGMNEPLRYKGYTFYQASVLTLPDGEIAPVLNVVRNTGWLFPYAASLLIFVGLGLHAWRRWHEKA